MSEVTIPLRSHDEAISVLGPYDRHARLLRQSLDVEVFTKGGNLRLRGEDSDVAEAQRRIEHLLGKLRKGRELDTEAAEVILAGQSAKPTAQVRGNERPPESRGRPPGAEPRSNSPSVAGPMRTRAIEPRSKNQRRYLEAIERNSLVFGLGAAGSGKTFLAVAAAVRALRSGKVRRVIISRPVVEAGEHLGFLPGDLQAKLDPYLRPIYDAFHGLMHHEDVTRLEEGNVIEIAPLAYMRGRTLSNAFVILDEAQNTTVAQMKMFLTRLGEGSVMVVTGDPSQSDLEGPKSGLEDASSRLRGYEGIGVIEFDARDIVRHPLVERILHAYEGPPQGAGRAEEREVR